MVRRARIVWIAAIAALLMPLLPGLCPAGGTTPTLLGASSALRDVPTERYYIALPNGDDDRLVSIFHALDAAGARGIHAMLPDLIVCEVPVDVDPHSAARGNDVVIVRSEDVAQLSGYGLRVDPTRIERGYAERELERRRGFEASPPSETTQDYECGVRTIPVEEMYRSVRRAQRINASASSRTGTDEARLMHQSSEMLIGNILVNIVLPESDYPNPWWENWSEESIEQVHFGFQLAFQRFVDEFVNADINVIYKFHDQVMITSEPIYRTPSDDKFWITLCLNELGYDGVEADALQNVHAFNDDMRARHGADWAFSAFIALAEKKWTGPTFADARMLSWSYLGGPYFVTSYPAGSFYWAEGIAQLARHEIGHIFWGLEEDKGPASVCGELSGYLNVVNGNKVTDYSPIDGSRSGCEGLHPIPCTMNETDQIGVGWDPGGCPYTQEMWGVSDVNENEVPDALDRAPIIEFYTADVETVITPVKQMGVRVVSLAVPNVNSKQPDDLRRDYAARIKDIDVAVGGLQPYTLEPSDIGSEGYEADFVVDLPEMIPGALQAHVGARNVYNAISPTRTKTYRYVHLLYTGFDVKHPNEGIGLSWNMIGELFDAHLVMHRRNLETGEETIIAEGFAPKVPTVEGITRYELLDDDTEPGGEYEYWVTGTIDLPYRDTTINKTVESIHVTSDGAVARKRTPKSPISNLAPNPFSTETWLSMEIPHEPSTAPGSGGGTAIEQASIQVKVTVYDVLGRRVNSLYQGDVIPDVLTISWNGTDDRGKALPSGFYFMRVEVGTGIKETRKLLLLR